MVHQLGFMLYQGQDDKPDFFCGYQLINNKMTAQFESNLRPQELRSPTRPVLFRIKKDGFDTWKDLEAQGIKVEMFQINLGYVQIERE